MRDDGSEGDDSDRVAFVVARRRRGHDPSEEVALDAALRVRKRQSTSTVTFAKRRLT